MFSLRAGVTVPLHGPNGKLAMMSFAQSSSYNMSSKLMTYFMTYLELAAISAFQSFRVEAYPAAVHHTMRTRSARFDRNT
nr:autoinducer binding domain-containing protein [Mesorhizobium caraganae]